MSIWTRQMLSFKPAKKVRYSLKNKSNNIFADFIVENSDWLTSLIRTRSSARKNGKYTMPIICKAHTAALSVNLQSQFVKIQ